jgi:hypothetical protein
MGWVCSAYLRFAAPFGAILLVMRDLLDESMKIDVYLLAKERIIQNTKRDDEKNIL